MKSVWLRLGQIIFLLGWPIFWLLSHGSQRTRVLLISENRVLLVRNWIGDGSWGLPGGGRHYNEPARTAALRELREETGIRLEPQALHSHGRQAFRHYGISFNYELFEAHLAACSPVRPQPLEIVEAAWFTRQESASLHLSDDVRQAMSIW